MGRFDPLEGGIVGAEHPAQHEHSDGREGEDEGERERLSEE